MVVNGDTDTEYVPFSLVNQLELRSKSVYVMTTQIHKIYYQNKSSKKFDWADQRL